MRVVLALVAALLLAGCESAPPAGDAKKSDGFARSSVAEAFASTGSGFDYRYAYRLPGDRLKAVLQSNADACDKLGPSRCRILAMRYNVDAANHIRAVLTIRIDPVIARAYGDAVTKAVTGSDGVLVDTEISGADSTSAARSASLVSRLQDQLRSAETQAATDPTARARADKLRNALATIAEIESGQGQSIATAPVLITYESSSAAAGLGTADANFRNAGATLENSVARVVTVLAAVGPGGIVILGIMLLIVLLLRWVVHGRAVPEYGEDAPNAVPASHDDGSARGDDRNLIQRWFARDEE
jgi:hypothetical protein